MTETNETKPKKKKRKLKKSAKIVLTLLAAGLVLLIVYATGAFRSGGQVVAEATPTASATSASEYCISDEQARTLYAEYEEDHAINEDVVGILYFQSELIHQPVVQGETNDTYLRTDWKTGEYQSYGSIFLDYVNDITADEENTIIYGHYVYLSRNADRTLAFTPLALLRDEANYEANKELVLVTADNIRYYEIYAVYDCPLVTEDGYQYTVEELQYNLVTYDPDYFNTYLAAIKENELYDTGETGLTNSDRLLTLQTCIEGNDQARQIVLCREVARRDIADLQ